LTAAAGEVTADLVPAAALTGETDFPSVEVTADVAVADVEEEDDDDDEEEGVGFVAVFVAVVVVPTGFFKPVEVVEVAVVGFFSAAAPVAVVAAGPTFFTAVVVVEADVGRTIPPTLAFFSSY
jgi:hypothetical protein